ncbi:MAG: hypothetical protein P1U78_04870 [Alcanivoracaceae bacterium]|nr:hypothetical protein [Alcanivoracaceae bacterium]
MTDQTNILSMKDAIQYLARLNKLQNEVVYVIECLDEDFRGEASRGLVDVYEALEKAAFPESADQQIRKVLEEAVEAINARDLILCNRRLQRIRRRLANEIAVLLGEKNPYAYCYYPLLSSDAEEPKQGFVRLSEKP